MQEWMLKCMHISSHCWVCLLFALNWPWDDYALLWSVDSVKILIHTHTNLSFLLLPLARPLSVYIQCFAEVFSIQYKLQHCWMLKTTLKELCCLIFYKNAHLKDTFAANDSCVHAVQELFQSFLRTDLLVQIIWIVLVLCNFQVAWQNLNWSEIRALTGPFQHWIFVLFLSLSSVNFAFCLSCWNTLSQIYFSRVKYVVSLYFSAFCTIHCSLYFQVLSLAAWCTTTSTLLWRYSAFEGVGSVRLAPQASLTILAENLYFGVI